MTSGAGRAGAHLDRPVCTVLDRVLRGPRVVAGQESTSGMAPIPRRMASFWTRCSGRRVSGGGPTAPGLGAFFGRPEKMEGTAVVAFNREEYGKYLVPSEIVVAYADGDEAVAWPLLQLRTHEVCNDMVGDVPVLIVHAPLSGLLVAYDRRVDGKVLEFGHSGLLYHSTPLLYDRTDPLGQERLWDPVTGEAVAGPDGPNTASLQAIAGVHWSLGRLVGRPPWYQNLASPQGRTASVTADSTMAATNWARNCCIPLAHQKKHWASEPRPRALCFRFRTPCTPGPWPIFRNKLAAPAR